MLSSVRMMRESIVNGSLSQGDPRLPAVLSRVNRVGFVESESVGFWYWYFYCSYTVQVKPKGKKKLSAILHRTDTKPDRFRDTTVQLFLADC